MLEINSYSAQGVLHNAKLSGVFEGPLGDAPSPFPGQKMCTNIPCMFFIKFEHSWKCTPGSVPPGLLYQISDYATG